MQRIELYFSRKDLSTAFTASGENPRPARKRACFAFSCKLAGGFPNFFCQTARAAWASLLRNRGCAASTPASDTPFSRISFRMRAAPNLLRRLSVSCSTKRASDNQPRRSKSSSSESSCSTLSANPPSLTRNSCRVCSRRPRAFSARSRSLSPEAGNWRCYSTSRICASGFSATWARIFASISRAISACSFRKSRVLSLP